jgi:uncharacterized DUF497 family protein
MALLGGFIGPFTLLVACHDGGESTSMGPIKSARTARHGFRSLAQRAFFDPRRVIAEDLSHSTTEQRYFCFGEVEGGIMTVRFTWREPHIRIFGAGYWRKGRNLCAAEPLTTRRDRPLRVVRISPLPQRWCRARRR